MHLVRNGKLTTMGLLKKSFFTIWRIRTTWTSLKARALINRTSIGKKKN